MKLSIESKNKIAPKYWELYLSYIFAIYYLLSPLGVITAAFDYAQAPKASTYRHSLFLISLILFIL